MYWGKGYIKEAADVVIEYLFDQLKIHRLEAYVESGNENSSKVLKKLDFQHEGLMRDCEVKNGEFISVDLFARINPKELDHLIYYKQSKQPSGCFFIG